MSELEVSIREISEEEAFALRDKLYDQLENLCVSMAEVLSTIKETQETDCWRKLNYDSWQEFYNGEYEGQIQFIQNTKLTLMERVELVKALSDGGMTNKEIAETTGMHRNSVGKLIKRADEPDESAHRCASTNINSAGQRVELDGHIYDDESELQIVEVRSTTREEETQQNWLDNTEATEEDKAQLDNWLDSIDLSKMIIPTPTQIAEPEPSDQPKEYFEPRPVAPSWSPPEIRELPPPTEKAYHDPEPEFLAQPVKLQKVQDPNQDTSKHCKTCNCNLLP